MIVFDLALGHRVIGCTLGVLVVLVVQVILQIL